MGIITVNIVVNNIGADTGPFDIYDNYTGLLITNVSKQDLLSGVSLDIRENATQITVVSKGICNNNLVVPITTFPLSPTPSPTPSISVSVTPSITPSISETPSLTPSVTPSITISPSIVVTRTPSATPSISISATPSLSPTPSISISPTATPSITISPSPALATINWANTDGSSPFVDSDLFISVNSVNVVTEYTTNSGTFNAANNSSISISQESTVGTIGSYRLIVKNVTDDNIIYDNTNSSVGSLPATVNTYSFTALGAKTYYVSSSTFPPPTPSPSATPSISPTATPSISISSTPSPSATIGLSVTPSVSRTPSVSISRTPTVTPSISISRTPTVSPTPSTSAPCCTYYDISISSTDTANAVSNSFYDNNVVFINYTDCYDTPQSLGLIAGTYINQICVKPGNKPTAIYYNFDNPVAASFSSASNTAVCCSPYPPPSASPTPSISISKTPTPSTTAGISVTPTQSPTPTPSVTPIGPEGFIFTDVFDSNALIDCTGEGDLGVVSTWEYTITIVNNCTSQTTTNAISNLSFTVDLGVGCGTDNITINAGSNTYSSTYERSNACTGLICNAEISSSPGTLTQC